MAQSATDRLHLNEARVALALSAEAMAAEYEQLAEGVRQLMILAALLERPIDECQAGGDGRLPAAGSRQPATTTGTQGPTMNVSNMSIAPTS